MLGHVPGQYTHPELGKSPFNEIENTSKSSTPKKKSGIEMPIMAVDMAV
jgi:hypothetical protein